MNDAAKIRCHQCKGYDLVKYGRTRAGLQKYRCNVPGCRHQFVAGSDHRIDPEKKKIVLALIAEGVPTQKILKAVPKISRRWLSELRRRMTTA